MKSIGAKAMVINNKNNVHSFRKKEEVRFVGMHSQGWYRFENELGLIQTLEDYHFEWID